MLSQWFLYIDMINGMKYYNNKYILGGMIMGKAGYISDAQVVKRAAAAVKIELEKKKAMDIPIAVYDRKTQTIYEEKSDGSRKVVGERLRRGRYSERIAKKA